MDPQHAGAQPALPHLLSAFPRVKSVLAPQGPFPHSVSRVEVFAGSFSLGNAVDALQMLLGRQGEGVEC